MTLLEIFRDPGKLAEMALADKIIGALQITVIGMALTFVALVLVWLAVRLLARIAAGSPARELQPSPLPRPITVEDSGEVAAAIAAVLTLIGDGSGDGFRVKKIARVPAGGSGWSDWNRE
ncbi:MAG: OadG family protein [Candidatus Erginobacter occultus]|nr:OadG family protein [Candidatus Erginobacter occultus]